MLPCRLPLEDSLPHCSRDSIAVTEEKDGALHRDDSQFPLFAAVVDYNATPATYERYDKMTARELFRQYGVSQALYDQFLKPLLLVRNACTTSSLRHSYWCGETAAYCLCERKVCFPPTSSTLLPSAHRFVDLLSTVETPSLPSSNVVSSVAAGSICAFSAQVGLFAPPEELSAAVVLDTFYFYSLAHQQDFDVCWCKGSVAERIFKPMMDR